MKLSVVGTGYVGLVAGVCFSDSGNHVVCVDVDDEKIKKLQRGLPTIFEPGLSEMMKKCQAAGRLSFTTDIKAAVEHGRLIFVAVGTPESSEGSADLSAVLNVATAIGRFMDGYRVIVMKSTVPVGTHQTVMDAIGTETDHPFDYVSNPEFMKEGAAIEDFTKPDRVIIGSTNHAASEIVRELYAPFMRKSERILTMDPASAEMTKYAANAMLATRISFMNEIAHLCASFGADVEAVRRGVGSDRRIGNAFLFPGAGYGGSCFPKDVQALISLGESIGRPLRLVAATHEANVEQRTRFAQSVIDHFGENGQGKKLAVWGLAFKAHTDDVRESPAIVGIRRFLEAGFAVRAFDPEAGDQARDLLKEAVEIESDQYEVLNGCGALVIYTDWPQFRTPDFDEIAKRLLTQTIFDGRNLYDPGLLAKRGFYYSCVGRPTTAPQQRCVAEYPESPRD